MNKIESKPMGGAIVWVGPVLQAGSLSDEIIAVLRRLNPEIRVVDRGGYHRVSAPKRCLFLCKEFEAATGRRFRLPGDLESVMSSFSGKLKLDEEQAVWEA